MNLLRNAVLKALLKGRDLISAGKAFQSLGELFWDLSSPQLVFD